MDGKEYLRAAVPGYERQELVSPRTLYEVPRYITARTARDLMDMLNGLYQIGEVHFLTDELAPIVHRTAQRFCDFENRLLAAAEGFSGQIGLAAIRRNIGRRTQFEAIEDNTGSMSTRQLTSIIDRQLAAQRQVAVGLSTRLLAESVASAQQRRIDIEKGKVTLSNIARGAFARHRTRFLAEVAPSAFFVDIVQDERARTIDVEARPRHGKMHIPEWLNTHDRWDSAVNRLASLGMLENDAYFALLQWCFDRKLPAIPIVAPPQLEASEGSGIQGTNTNADILLCSLAGNKIVPIQVKNSFRFNNYDRYIAGFKFIGPTQLGLVDLQTRIVRRGGRSHSAAVSVTHYGAHVVEFVNRSAHPRGTPARSSALEKAYKYFDLHLLPDLAA